VRRASHCRSPSSAPTIRPLGVSITCPPEANSLPFRSYVAFLPDVMKGYNGTVFSYGQTGSGASRAASGQLPSFVIAAPHRSLTAHPLLTPLQARPSR
jgi:hypothetical protein